MKLIDHWNIVLKMSWAVRFAGMATAFETIVTTMRLMDGFFTSPWWSVITVVLAFLSGAARLVEQAQMKEKIAVAETKAAVTDQTKLDEAKNA